MQKRFMLFAATLLVVTLLTTTHRAASSPAASHRASATTEHRSPECTEGWNEVPLPCHCSGIISRSGNQANRTGDIQMPGFCTH